MHLSKGGEIVRKAIVILFLVALISGCTTIDVKDPVKASLYTMKQEWTAIREYVMRENLLGRLSDEELNLFKVKDAEFSRTYGVALDLYLMDTQSPSLELTLKTLRNLLIDARHKYMEGGISWHYQPLLLTC